MNRTPTVLPGIFGSLISFGYLLAVIGLITGLVGLTQLESFTGPLKAVGGGMLFIASIVCIGIGELASVVFSIEQNTRATHQVLNVACSKNQ